MKICSPVKCADGALDNTCQLIRRVLHFAIIDTVTDVGGHFCDWKFNGGTDSFHPVNFTAITTFIKSSKSSHFLPNTECKVGVVPLYLI